MTVPTTSIPASETALTKLVAGTTPATIEDVISLMQAIDAILPSGDGLKWFNKLYMMVTEAVLQHPPAAGWNNAAWLERLDVIFANLYFSALRAWGENRAAAPSAWKALLASRYRTDLSRIQFALAGMNAHINHDLPLALVTTGTAMRITPRVDTPEHADYQNVNLILDTVEPQAMQYLATGIMGEIAEDLGHYGTLMAQWSIRKARDTAWDNAEILWDLKGIPMLFDRYVGVMDRMTGFAGRGLLTPLRV